MHDVDVVSPRDVMAMGVEQGHQAIFPARKVIAMGLEKGDFLRERRAGYGPNAIITGLEKAIFSRRYEGYGPKM